MPSIKSVGTRMTSFGHALKRVPSKVKTGFRDLFQGKDPFAERAGGGKKLSECDVQIKVSEQKMRGLLEPYYGPDMTRRVLDKLHRRTGINPSEGISFENSRWAMNEAANLSLYEAADRVHVNISDWDQKKIETVQWQLKTELFTQAKAASDNLCKEIADRVVMEAAQHPKPSSTAA